MVVPVCAELIYGKVFINRDFRGGNMSKSILILDTPTSCVLCPFSHYNDIYRYQDCRAYDNNWRKIPDYNRQRKHIGSNDIRPNWCPLSPLPELKDLTKYTTVSTGSTGLEKIVQYAHDQGYNDCLYHLSGGNINV